MVKIEIPNEFMGVPVNERTLKETLAPARTQQRTQQNSSRNAPIQINTQINPREYIPVPQHGIVIAREIGYKGNNWNETLDALAGDGLIMPRIDHFMTHFMNVKEAVSRNSSMSSSGGLTYADGTPVSDDETEKLWNYISSTNRGNMGVCWTWLDAKFRQAGGNFQLETDHRKGSQPNVYDLKRHTSKGLVDLNFNDQGLPTRQSRRDSYFQGDNMYFWNPVDGDVAGFLADSGGADLGCGRGIPVAAMTRSGYFRAPKAPRAKI